MTHPAARPPALRPREHGAYAQLGISLAAALVLAGGRPGAWAICALTLLVFFASEPLFVLLGLRGEDREPRRAIQRLLLLGLLALPPLWLMVRTVPPFFLPNLLVPLMPGLALTVLFLRKEERTPWGELLGAFTFAACAHPAAVAGGQSLPLAAQLMGNLTATFALAAIAVRTLRLPPKNHLAPIWRALPTVTALGIMALLADFHDSGWIPRASGPALVPIAATTLLLAFWTPKRFKVLGWVLTAGALGSAVWTVAALR